MRRGLLGGFLLLFAVGAVPGCGRASREIRIGSILSLSGEGQYYGERIKHGMDLAVEHLNREGGVRGRPVEILYRDSQSRPEVARAAAEELYRKEKVAAVIGAVLSSETLAVAPLAEGDQKILLSPASSSPKITQAGRFIFRIYPSDVLEGAYMAEFASRELRLRKVAILAVQNEYGEGLLNVFQENFRGGDREVVQVLRYPDRDPDYRALVSRLKDQEPEGIYLVGYYREVAGFLREFRRSELEAVILSVAGFHSQELLDLAGKAAEGVIFPHLGFDTDSDDLHVRRFVRAYRDRFGLVPDDWAAHGYDAVMILAKGMARGGEVPDRIRKSLLEMKDFRGVAGVISFDERGDVVKYPRFYIVHQKRFVLYKDYLFEKSRREAS